MSAEAYSRTPHKRVRVQHSQGGKGPRELEMMGAFGDLLERLAHRLLRIFQEFRLFLFTGFLMEAVHVIPGLQGVESDGRRVEDAVAAAAERGVRVQVLFYCEPDLLLVPVL